MTLFDVETQETAAVGSGRSAVDEVIADLPAASASVAPVGRSTIAPWAIALAWFAAIMGAVAIDPAQADPERPTLLLRVLAEGAFYSWLAVLGFGAARSNHTAKIGMGVGALMLSGHLICGAQGHVPMTSGIWVTQLMLIAGAAGLSTVATATNR